MEYIDTTTKELKKYKYDLTVVPEKYLNDHIDRENGMSIRDNGSFKIRIGGSPSSAITQMGPVTAVAQPEVAQITPARIWRLRERAHSKAISS